MAKPPRSLSGKVAVVTGAAGGVGRATAHALVREGARIAILDLDADQVAAVVADLGPGATGSSVDLSDISAYERFLDDVERDLGPIDILANVAGIMPVGPFEAETDSTTARQIAVNLAAVIHSTKHVGRRMKHRGTGHIVNVASGAGFIAGGGGATYCATKFGVVGFSEAVSLELRGTGVEVSVVAPAVIKTEMSTGLKELRGIRAVTPEEVAGAIVDGLKNPRFAIFVPKGLGPMALAFSAIPHRPRHALARLMKSDKLLLDVDVDARRLYESRVLPGEAAGRPGELPSGGEAASAGSKSKAEATTK